MTTRPFPVVVQDLRAAQRAGDEPTGDEPTGGEMEAGSGIGIVEDPLSTSSDVNVAAVFGAHLVLFSEDADADRSFLADVFDLESVDAGGGWLIFALPPAEVAVHPAEAPGAELYFMCDDLEAEMRSLSERGVACSAVEEARWGSITKISLPGGGELGLYQPRHPLAIKRDS